MKHKFQKCHSLNSFWPCIHIDKHKFKFNHEYHNLLKSTKYRFGSSSSSSDIFSSLNLYENAFSTAPFRRYCLLQFTTYTKQKFIYCVVFFFYNQTAHEMQRTNEAAPCSKQCAQLNLVINNLENIWIQVVLATDNNALTSTWQANTYFLLDSITKLVISSRKSFHSFPFPSFSPLFSPLIM